MPYLYTYLFGDGSSQWGANDSITQNQYRWPGTYHWNFWVNDSANGSVHISGRIVVEKYPVRVSDPATSPHSVDLGQTVTFRVNVTGGSGNYTYTWFGLPPGCPAGNVSRVTCMPSQANNTTLYVTARDSFDLQGTSNGTPFNTFGDPYFQAVVANPGSIDLGQSTILEAFPGGGSGGFSYTWALVPAGCTAANAPNLTCTPSLAGRYTVSVRAVDSNGISTTGSFALDVSPRLSVGNVAAVPSRIDLGQSLQLSASASGGSFPYAFQWVNLPPGCPYLASGLIACTPSATGAFNVSVRVSDANLASQSSTGLRITVDPALSLQASPRNGTIPLGSAWSVSLAVVGGTQPFSFAFSGLPGGCAPSSTANYTCVPSVSGTYAVTIEVTDAANGTASTIVTVSVLQTGPTQSSSTLLYAEIGAVAAIVLASAAIVLNLRRRRTNRSSSDERPPAR